MTLRIQFKVILPINLPSRMDTQPKVVRILMASELNLNAFGIGDCFIQQLKAVAKG